MTEDHEKRTQMIDGVVQMMFPNCDYDASGMPDGSWRVEFTMNDGAHWITTLLVTDDRWRFDEEDQLRAMAAAYERIEVLAEQQRDRVYEAQDEVLAAERVLARETEMHETFQDTLRKTEILRGNVQEEAAR